MGMVLDKILLPGKRSYSADNIPSPPLVYIARVPCLKITPLAVNVDKVVLYMHGNGEDLGTVWRSMLPFAEKLNAVVYCMEYRGYGIHTGDTSPRYTVVDGARVLRSLSREHHKPIHLLGYSIGTAVASAVAASNHYDVASLTLIAPFHSPHAMVKHVLGLFMADMITGTTHPFNTADNLREFGRPVLAIHGRLDGVVPINQSHMLLSELGPNHYELLERPHDDHFIKLEHVVDDFLRHMQAVVK
jgi:pimeloyl-ACP methyl ester carboxylesterase